MWAVVTTSAEPAPVLCAFVAHHLRMGAEHIYVFLDSPDPALADLLADLPQCSVTVCHRAYWEAAGGRPVLVTERQKYNAQRIYDHCPYRWLLHADADEYLAPNVDLKQKLADVPADSEIVRLPIAERVRRHDVGDENIFDPLFRNPLDPRRVSDPAVVYGRNARYLQEGVKGYTHYKSLCRTGQNLRIGIHTALGLDAARRQRGVNLRRPALFHYDGFTPKSWVRKMHLKAQIEDWRTKGPRDQGRARQLRVFADDRIPPQQLLRFYDRLDRIDADQRAQLADARAISTPQLDLESTARARFPDADLDFSIAAFDRATLSAPEDGFLETLARLAD